VGGDESIKKGGKRWRGSKNHCPTRGATGWYISAWHIDEKDLRRYIRQYPEELTARNCDIMLIVDILAEVINGQNG